MTHKLAILFITAPILVNAALTSSPALPAVPVPGAKSATTTIAASSSSTTIAHQTSSATMSLAQSSSSFIAVAPVKSVTPPPPPKPLRCNESSANKSTGDSLLALGHWSQAASTYDQVCPCLKAAERIACKLLTIRALSQDTATIQEAVHRLDTMAIAAEPEDAGFGELMLTQTALLLKVGNPERALKSWRLAKQVAIPGQEANLKALCTQIRAQWKDSSLVADCSKIPALAKPLATAISSSAIHASSTSTKITATTSSSAAEQSLTTSSSAAVAKPAPQGSWLLQFGAFSNRENAELLLKNLKSRKIPSRIVTKNTAEKVLWLVQTEPFPSKEAATTYGQNSLNPLGLDYQAIPAP